MKDKELLPMTIKRVNNEIIELYSKYKNLNINYSTEIINLKIENIEFHINNRYPFHPPLVFIRDSPYIKFLKYKSERIKHFLYDYIGNDCICCSTIICSSNWTATYHIQKIVDEIKHFNYLKRIVKYKIAIETILNKKNIPIVLNKTIFDYLYE
jgi:hypothetical protein